MVVVSRSQANPRLLIRYLRWGVYVGIAAPLISVALSFDDQTEHVVTTVTAIVVATAGLEVMARWTLDRVDPLGRVLDRRWVVVAAVAVAVAVVGQPVVMGAEGPWPPTVGLVVALTTCLLTMPLRLWQALVVVVLVILGGTAGLIALRGVTEPTGVLVGVWMVTVPLLVLAWWTTGWMLRVMRELEEARDRAATAAVAEERARISRDLHDLFGQTLATIAVKSELAAELAVRGRYDQAATEMREVHRIADESGGRVRAVVRGDQQADLESEVAGARALLGSAQIRCHADHVAVDHPHADVLVWALRESVTNVLRHTDARTVDLQVGPTANGGAQLRVSNDRPPSGPITEGGGIAGMRQRVEAVGGSIAVGTTAGGVFRVTVTLPAERSGT